MRKEPKFQDTSSGAKNQNQEQGRMQKGTCQDSSPLKEYETCFFLTSGRVVLFSPLHVK